MDEYTGFFLATSCLLGLMARTRGGWIVFKRFSQILCLEWNFNNQLREAIQKANQNTKQKQIAEF